MPTAGEPPLEPRLPDDQSSERAGQQAPATPPCDICGSVDTAWERCKLVCRSCHTILMTCGDL